MTMKTATATRRLLAAAITAGCAYTAAAFPYAPGDLILIFRKPGANDVEFNLGSIGRLLDAPAGSTITLTNWDKSLVAANYLFSDDGVTFVLAAATSSSATNRGIWLTSGEPATVPLDRTPSQWQQLWSKVDALGNKPAEYTLTNATPSLSVSPALYPSYTYIASNAGSAPALAGKVGGACAFTVENRIPAAAKFYEIRPSTIPAKPAALLAGAFQLSVDGTLTYTAAGGATNPPAPVKIASISAIEGGYRISFPTAAGTHYRLRYTSVLDNSPGGWTAGSASADGTGGSASLDDAAPAGATRFYTVESY